ncbi:glycoside hydrolase 5 family protein [Humisphaera borealis]|uniref:Cellulase family glycosylhydrolase n=1 Tax=Humisphaera borealis TaxID=2807512 RepID=A0A7M2X3G9_9BACT|nr:cellulase family glycosylhydrolase [Humisphaera borealis]QOV92224.1 cellulase family glycosylhydrolase [Humisphaera borealis]
MTPGQPFILGINYWPRKKSVFWWEQFDAAEVREEFAMIRDIGITHVRFFLLWESFQPTPRSVSPTAMKHLRTVCDIASELGLKLQPTFFTGHMSGPNWTPPWLVDKQTPRKKDERQLCSLQNWKGYPSSIFNTYDEPFVIEAEDLLLKTVCSALKDHPAIWGYSLGNEPDLFCKPATADIGRRWVRDRVATIREADPNHLALIGVHTASIDSDCGLRVDHIAGETDVSVMHGYSIYHPLARHALDPDYVPFVCALTAALAGRPVLFEEFGINTHWPNKPSFWQEITNHDGTTRKVFFASEEDAATYYAGVLKRLVKVGAIGAFCWCFPDYDKSIWDRPPCDFQPFERFFGLWRPDGSLKPMGQAVKDFIATRPRVQAPEKVVKLPVTADEYYRNPWEIQKKLYAEFGEIAP